MSEYIVLIPTTRDIATVGLAINSVQKDGWDFCTINDTLRIGANKIRESLLDVAFLDKNINFIRYMDDDDILLPHLAEIKEAFEADPSLDIVYTDAIMQLPSGFKHRITFSGNPQEEILKVYPWSWVAKKSALEKVRSQLGYVWDPMILSRHGGRVWLNFLVCNLTFKYLPILSYCYNQSFNPDCISQSPAFGDETRKLEMYIKNLK